MMNKSAEPNNSAIKVGVNHPSTKNDATIVAGMTVAATATPPDVGIDVVWFLRAPSGASCGPTLIQTAAITVAAISVAIARARTGYMNKTH